MVMKLKLLIFIYCLLFYTVIVKAHSGDTIIVQSGAAPVVDGVLSPGEWSDASFIQIPSFGGTVYFKHTATDLYIAFADAAGYNGSSGMYVDRLHNGGTTPQTDDSWLHGSASQWEWYGSGTLWQNVTPSGWTYAVNSANEFKISFSKLGITSTDTIGVLFSFVDWSMGSEITWPTGGYPNCSNPNSWADMVILITTGIKENSNNNDEINFFPNPCSNKVFIELKDYKNIIIEILSIKEKLLKRFTLQHSNPQIDINNLPEGIYFLKIITDKGTTVKKIIKQ